MVFNFMVIGFCVLYILAISAFFIEGMLHRDEPISAVILLVLGTIIVVSSVVYLIFFDTLLRGIGN